ncbi:hypothetical protein ACFQ95_05280 [Variovorax sp. HJSM1_2]
MKIIPKLKCRECPTMVPGVERRIPHVLMRQAQADWLRLIKAFAYSLSFVACGEGAFMLRTGPVAHSSFSRPPT